MDVYNRRNPDRQPFTGANQDQLVDQGPKDATFDTAHQVYTNPLVSGSSQQAILDNSDFPADATLTATLSYSYTSGYSTVHEQTKAVTVGVTQEFDFKFGGVGEGTTLTASGTFSWTDSEGENHSSTLSSGVQESLVVPAGKIYQAKIIYHQENVSVPYSWTGTISGSYVMNFDGGSVLNNIGATYGAVTDPNIFGPMPAMDGVNWNDFHRSGFGPAPGNDLSFTLNGTLTVQGASAYVLKNYDITNMNNATQLGEVHVAQYDPNVPVGVHHKLDDTGRTFVDTPFDDWVQGGDGADQILLRGGEEIAHGGGGDDVIHAGGVGHSLINGGDGHDIMHLVSTAPGSTLRGGRGNDTFHVDAPGTMLYGGAGDDFYALKGATVGGTVITDANGNNELEIDEGRIPVHFERVEASNNLYILLGGGETYDRARDVVWVNFFANRENQVNGMTAAQIAELAVTFIAPVAPPDADVVIA